MPLSLYILDFQSGYHVGWRRPERLIDGFTVLRALANVGFMLGYERLAEEIARGLVASTSLLPTLPAGGCHKLLVPFPMVPSLQKISKLGLEFATVGAASRILDFARSCIGAGGTPILRGRLRGEQCDRIVFWCAGRDSSLELCAAYSVACSCDECSVVREALERVGGKLVDYVEEVHTRVDRVTGAADPYVLHGYRPRVPLWLGVDAPSGVEVKHVIEALGRLGLGGFRSRGWGRFTLREATICDHELLAGRVGWSEGPNLLLSSIPGGDWMEPRRSFTRLRVVAGLAGPPSEAYRLPRIHALDAGSLVYAKRRPEPFIRVLATSAPGFTPYIVFNPIVMH